MNRTSLILLLCLLSSSLLGASFHDDFAVVFIDAATEAKYGDFPFDRSILAKAVQKSADLGAKGVVLKFFLDQPKSEAGDAALAAAMTNIPVVLQARMDDAEKHPNQLPDRFTFSRVVKRTAVSGQNGWIPIPRFIANVKDIGFVDFDSVEVPLLETYQSHTVKSLVVCCIEMATGQSAVVTNGSLRFGAKSLLMSATNTVTATLPGKDDLAYLPFHELLEGKVPAGAIKGKVVIIDYDGAKIHSLPTAIGNVRAHRFFIYDLRSIYEQAGR